MSDIVDRLRGIVSMSVYASTGSMWAEIEDQRKKAADEIESLRAQREALQARLAEIERQEPVEWKVEKHDGSTTRTRRLSTRIAVDNHVENGWTATALYAAPVSPAAQAMCGCGDTFGEGSVCANCLCGKYVDAGQAVAMPDDLGPDVSDGHDWEGFAGGCARFGCGDGCKQPVPAAQAVADDVARNDASTRALRAAVSAIYFDDGSDYESALWTVVAELGGNEVATMLEENDRMAYLMFGADPEALDDEDREWLAAAAKKEGE